MAIKNRVMALSSVTRGWPAQVTPSTALLGTAAAALIAIDLVHLTIATGLAALVLAAVVAAYLVRRVSPLFGLYVFLIAELSPISLTADLLTAVLYQAFSLLLLTAVIAPLPHVATRRVYGRPVLVTLLLALVSLAPGVALFYSKWLTGLQAASLSGAILLVVVGALLFVRRDNAFIRRALGV